MSPVKRALVSVSNKAGIEEFVSGLVELGIQVISTGGTAKRLHQAGLPVVHVSDITGFPEILDGRVKTLHPLIHAGILALRTEEHLKQLKEHGIEPIDMIVVNLYPFQETVARDNVRLEEAIENIDIGGPAMLRAAAKNYHHVLAVVNPERYPEVLSALRKGEVREEMRISLAWEAFVHTAAYDAAIATYLQGLRRRDLFFPQIWFLTAQLVQPLRYGENPHQRAAFYRDPAVKGPCIANAIQIAGKELSFNNILDLNSALELVREFTEPSVVIVKHNNPCGVASAPDVSTAYRLAYEGDPVSAFGGIVGCNRPVDKDMAEEIAKTFLEAVIAPDYTDEALKTLTLRSNLRLLKTGSLMGQSSDYLDLRKVNGGLLVQEADREVLSSNQVRVVTERKPDKEELDEMAFAMTVVKHVKSNAIVITRNRQLVGTGAGQMNRVGAARIALTQAGERARGGVMASDAFFPFRDTVDEAAKAGIRAIIQPGGSLRDDESIQACNEHGIAMIFTGIRHFKH